MLSLKLVSSNNYDYLWKTYKASMQTHVTTIWGWDLAWQQADFAKSLAKYQTRLIVISEKTIGYIQYKNNLNDCFINMLILEPPYQSEGLGQITLNLIAQKNQSKSLSLKCFKINQRAYKFYLNNGFMLHDYDEHFYFLRKNI